MNAEAATPGHDRESVAHASALGARNTATAVGVLFITATGLYMAGQALHGPVLDSPDSLALAHGQRTRVIAGVLIELGGVLAIPLIAVFLFPVLRRYNQTAALAYVALRVLEAVPLVMVGSSMWAMVDVSGSYLEAGATAESWRTMASMLELASNTAFLVSVAVIFPIGALVLNTTLWCTRLVPRLISGWGLVGAALLLVGSVLSFFEMLPAESPTALEVVLSGPIALQEMALALWLIVKGFSGLPGRVPLAQPSG